MPAFAVLGAGAWGTALAFQLARVNPEHTIYLWGYNPAKQKLLQEEQCNRSCFPNHPFLSNIHPVIELTDAMTKVSGIVLAIPSHGFADLIKKITPLCSTELPILSLTKGLDPHSGKFLHTVMPPNQHFAILSGPSFAAEVIQALPTAVTVASTYPHFGQFWQTYLHSSFFRVYTIHDIIGVQLAGTLKNVMAIATGIADGLGFGANARAGLITRGLAEMSQLSLTLGGEQQTLMGLAGVGDLVLTCTDNQSRNRRFGLALGAGKSIQEALAEIQQVVEGYLATKLVHNLAQQHKIEMPICHAVYEVLYENIPLHQAIQELLARPPHPE